MQIIQQISDGYDRIEKKKKKHTTVFAFTLMSGNFRKFHLNFICDCEQQKFHQFPQHKQLA